MNSKALKTSVAAAIAGLILAVVPATGAVAADGPSLNDLLDRCVSAGAKAQKGKVLADSCVFVPVSKSPYIEGQHQVSPLAPNCTYHPVDLFASWSDTKGSSDTVGGAVTVGAEAGALFAKASVSLTASYGHEWNRSSTKGGQLRITIPPGNVAYVTKSSSMAKVTGYYKLNFPSRQWGHYYWQTRHITITTGDKANEYKEVVMAKNRVMTLRERGMYCNRFFRF